MSLLEQMIKQGWFKDKEPIKKELFDNLSDKQVQELKLLGETTISDSDNKISYRVRIPINRLNSFADDEIIITEIPYRPYKEPVKDNVIEFSLAQDKQTENIYEMETALNRLQECKDLLKGRRHLVEVQHVLLAIDKASELLEKKL